MPIPLVMLQLCGVGIACSSCRDLRHKLLLVVLLVDDSSAFEPDRFQQGSDFIHHLAKAADVHVDIAAGTDSLYHVLLHAADSSCPARFRPRERGPKVKIEMCSF